MLRSFQWTMCIAVLMAIGGLLLMSQRGPAQATSKVATSASAKADKDSLHELLDQYIAVNSIQAPTLTIKQFLEVVYLRMDSKGARLPIIFDVDAFKEGNPDFDDNDLYDTKVSFSPFPPEMTVREALRLALQKIPTKNATFVVMPAHILITTRERTSINTKLNEKVNGAYDKRPIKAVLAELSNKVGVTIVVDSRIGDKAFTPVSVTLMNDVPLAGALRTITEMADLKAIVLDGAIFVTTPAHAEALRKEYKSKAPLQQPGPVAANPLLNADPFWPFVPDLLDRQDAK